MSRHLNYNHLLYFWTVAREGSVSRAAEVLHLTPQTISGQIKSLEADIGERLFVRAGRGLSLTEAGRSIMPYVEDIFSVGLELASRVQQNVDGAGQALQIGIVNSIPKLVAFQSLEPVFLEEKVRLLCQEGELERLLADLAIHRLDLVLSDRPIPTGMSVRAYNHRMGDSPIAFYASTSLANRLEKDFPQSLQGVPMLLPVITSAIRSALDDWLADQQIIPRVIAEFDDSALMKAFGAAGTAVFPAPEVIGEEVALMYGARKIGRVPGLNERYYAISPERKLNNPVVVAIIEGTRARFGYGVEG